MAFREVSVVQIKERCGAGSAVRANALSRTVSASIERRHGATSRPPLSSG